ncbi:MAG: ABC transporter permease [Opitutaceae bacterium]|nr:ABC transporter permease [Opitutaceae bacterium]
MLRQAPLILFAAIVLLFGALAPKFLTADNAINVLIQAVPTAIVAVGMTFVLLTAGVDLSVGAIMFLGGAIAGKLLVGGQPLPLALGAILAVGVAFGALNAVFVTRLRIAPFIVTLALLFIGRGVALTITQTRAMNLPDSFLQLGATRIAGVPLPLMVLGAVVLTAQVVLMHTPFGRQIYAVGNHPANARRAGIRTQRILAAVYIICGFCAALGGILSLAQLGAVSPKFGEAYEFKAIAAAVLGGTSLFGGRGAVFPGTVLGAVLIQSIETGLVILNADPYAYPVVTAAVILIAVLVDSVRNTALSRLTQRRIRVDA